MPCSQRSPFINILGIISADTLSANPSVPTTAGPSPGSGLELARKSGRCSFPSLPRNDNESRRARRGPANSACGILSVSPRDRCDRPLGCSHKLLNIIDKIFVCGLPRIARGPDMARHIGDRTWHNPCASILECSVIGCHWRLGSAFHLGNCELTRPETRTSIAEKL